MANGNETTTKFRVDISELKSAMQEARRQVSLSNSEFKATSSSLDNWAQSTDGISAKLKQLKTNLKSQETVLAEYEKTLEQVKKEYGENSKEATEYTIKLNNQQAVVNKTKSEIGRFESTLKEVADAEKIAAKTGKDVSDVLGDMNKETQDTGEGFTVMKGAVAEFVGNGLTALADGLKNAVGNLINLASETREYREDMNKLNTAFTTAGFTTEQASKVYKDFYAVLGEEDRSVEAVNHLAKLVDSEKDLQTWTDICTGVWGTFGDSLPIEGLTEAANETAKTGQLTGSLADALNWAGVSEDSFQEKLDGLSTEQERSAFITETLNGLYSDTADVYRKNNKNVLAANKAQSDYTDTLATMGETIEPLTTTVKEGVTGLLNEFLKLVEDVDMEEFSAKTEEAFEVLTDDVLPAVKEGLGWILDNKDMIIAGLAGIATGFLAFKVASLIQGVTTAMQGMTVAQYALNLAMNLNPIGIVVALLAGLVAAIVVLWNKSDEFREFFIGLWEDLKTSVEEAVNKIGEFFSGLWTEITNVFSDIGNWFKTKFTEAKDNALNAWSNAKEEWSGIKDKVTGAFNSVGNWFENKFTEAKNNAVNSWSNAKEKFTNVKDKVTGAFNSVGNWFKTKFTDAKNNALNAWSNAKEKFTSVKDKVTGAFSAVGSWFKTKFTEAKNNAVNAWSNVKEKFTSAKNNIIGAFGDLGSKLKEKFRNALNSAKDGFNNIRIIGQDIVTGLWNGISDKTSWVIEKIKGFGESVLGGIKDFFGIHSPSRVMRDEVGKNLAIGVAEGISKNEKYAEKSVKEMSGIILETAKKKLDKYQTYNKMTLAEEVAYWDKIRKTIKSGTAARLEADKEYLSKKNELNEQLKELEKNYRDESRQVYKDLITDIDELTSNYEESVKERAKSITNSLKLFDTVELDDAVNKADLKSNLEEQVKALNQWDSVLTKLSKRGLSDSLMEELEGMGIENLKTLKQLNSMNDKELAEYMALYEQKEAIANMRAKKENADLETETKKQIDELVKSAKSQLSALENTYKSDLEAIGVTVSDSSANIGKNLLSGIQKGMEDNWEYFTKYVKNFFDDVVSVSKKALEIKSPSRVFANEVGKWIPEGIVLGIDKNAKSVLNSMRDLTRSTIGIAKSELGTDVASSTGITGGIVNNFTQNINSPKALSRLEIYRQSKNLLGYAGGAI